MQFKYFIVSKKRFIHTYVYNNSSKKYKENKKEI